MQLCFVCFWLLSLLPARNLVQFFGTLLIFPVGTQIRGVPNVRIQKVTESSDFGSSALISQLLFKLGALYYAIKK